MKDEQIQQEKDKEFKNFALFTLRNINENRELYNKLPVTLKHDSKVVITAIKKVTLTQKVGTIYRIYDSQILQYFK